MKAMFDSFAIVLIIFALIPSGCVSQTGSSQPSVERLTRDIRQVLPKGWQCIAITEIGKMGHPHGLEEPKFRLDFVKTNETFRMEAAPRLTNVVHPNFRLHFHDIEEREHVLRAIEADVIFCCDGPTLFAETKQFMVVTSSSWINQTIQTNETGLAGWSVAFTGGEIGKRVKPLRKALKDYCDPQK